MIALTTASPDHGAADAPARFLPMLPAIRQQAQIAFRGFPDETRDELVAEAIAHAYVAFVRLCRRGLQHVAYPSPLANFAVKQVHAGRRAGSKLNIRDVTSRHCQRRKGVKVERLDHYDREVHCWKEIVVEDKRATPADVAATRLDFAAWLATLPKRLREIVHTLATGETTGGAARQFGVSPGRISQIRGQLRQAWEAFHGEPVFA